MLMIGNWPKGFPLRSKVIDYLSPPTGKHGGIITPLHYESTGLVLYQISNKSQQKKCFIST